jgi:hypothetical protein
MKQISIDALNSHLFEAIEGLKNNKDPKADECEKMDIETAREIGKLGKTIVEGYKVKAQVLIAFSKADNPEQMKQLSASSGITDGEQK